MSPLTTPQARMCQDGHCGLVGPAELVSHHLESGQGSYMLTEALAERALGSPLTAACSPAPEPPLRPGPLHPLWSQSARPDGTTKGRQLTWELRVGMQFGANQGPKLKFWSMGPGVPR